MEPESDGDTNCNRFSKGLVKSLDDLELKGCVEINQTAVFYDRPEY